MRDITRGEAAGRPSFAFFAKDGHPLCSLCNEVESLGYPTDSMTPLLPPARNFYTPTLSLQSYLLDSLDSHLVLHLPLTQK